MPSRYHNVFGVYSFDKECRVKWGKLNDKDKMNHIKYLAIMSKVSKNIPLTISEKLFILRSNIDITIVPIEFHEQYNLGEAI